MTRLTAARSEPATGDDLKGLRRPPILRESSAQFIRDALRAGQPAILVTGRAQFSSHVPEAALASCASASVRTLHIRPPLPEPAEMQEMIGAAVEIAGGREMAPLAMAARLLFLDPRLTVILAIDDAHTLSHRSLLYLTEMTELLAPDAPVLQIVLAAKPALLDTLARPEFETLRDRLCRPQFESFQPFQPFREAEDDAARSSPPKLAAVALAQAPSLNRIAASPRTAHHRNRRVVGLGAVSRLAAVGFCYFAFDFPLNATLPTIPSPISASLQKILAASEFPQWLGLISQRRNRETIDAAAPVLRGTVPEGNADATRRTTIAKARPPAPPIEVSTPPTEPSTEQRGEAGGAIQETWSQSAERQGTPGGRRSEPSVRAEAVARAQAAVRAEAAVRAQAAVQAQSAAARATAQAEAAAPNDGGGR